MVATHLKNISQKVGVKIKNIWNHHLAREWNLILGHMLQTLEDPKHMVS